LSRGVCGIVCTAMKTLRILCFASLLAVILLCGTAGSGGSAVVVPPLKPPSFSPSKLGYGPADLRPAELLKLNHGGCGTAPSGSGTMTITMTGAAGDPGDISQGK
jgi:hypothetical protein